MQISMRHKPLLKRVNRTNTTKEEENSATDKLSWLRNGKLHTKLFNVNSVSYLI